MLFEMNRVLMCRNHPVLEFAYSSNAGFILEVGDVFDPSRVPVGMYVDGQPRPDSDSVTAWWRSRGIPATRDGLRTLLMATGIPSGKELLDRSMGLSLSDQYWIRPAGMDTLRWEDLNFFHNDFDERLGKALFTGDSSRIGDVNTPDVTSAGDLPKRWIIRDDGVRTLIKAGRSGQEPDNERIAWKTARLLGIDHVEYRVGRINGARVSACDEMLSDTEELIPAGQIMRIFRKGGYRERRDIWVEACQRLGVDRDTIMHATDDFLFLDFLLRNTDRHYNNFGLIRDVESFAIRPAPIYDSGASLWNGMDPDAMDNGDYRTKPFWTDQWGEEDNAYWQLSLIDDWDRYDLGVLDDVPDIVHEQLSTNQRLSPMLIDRITGLLRGRLPIIRHQRNTTATRHMIGMTPIHGLDNPSTGQGLQPPDPADIPDDTRPDDPGIGLV